MVRNEHQRDTGLKYIRQGTREKQKCIRQGTRENRNVLDSAQGNMFYLVMTLLHRFWKWMIGCRHWSWLFLIDACWGSHATEITHSRPIPKVYIFYMRHSLTLSHAWWLERINILVLHILKILSLCQTRSP